MKRILLSMAIMMIACISAFAQVPTVMMYQVQIKHGKAAAQDVTIEMQLRNTQNGSAVWNQTFNLKDVKNGSVQNLGLDFGDKVNLSTGEYWLATIIDGEEMGCAKLTSVPYAMVTKSVEGVITPEELVGTWNSRGLYESEEENDDYYYTYTFKSDGSFTFLREWYYANSGTSYETKSGSGIWKLNGAGNLYVKSNHEENVVNTYLDRKNGTLTIGAGDSYIFGDVTNLIKGRTSSSDDSGDNTNKGEIKSEFIGKWVGTLSEDGYSFSGNLICNTDGTYKFYSEDEGIRSFSGTWRADESKLYLTGFFEESCSYSITDTTLHLNGTGWTATFTKSTTR